MTKIDLKKELKHLYKPSAKEVVLVDVPPLHYLMIDGRGDPNTSQEYADAVQALYAVSYAIKFMMKKSEAGSDYVVMPLEGLWWAEDMAQFSVENKSDWLWTMMILQPDFVTEAVAEQAMRAVQKKKGLDAIAHMRFETLTEGPCAQTLHIGPFSEEGPTVQRVHDFIEERGELAGKHHEIYLSDIRRADPTRWRTVIRQPMNYHEELLRL